ncbi:MAG TPA: hypothetical protein VKB02_18060, partial [Pyrinomonadaceae bacterium]|nr:hypothetical protein [Pyrinomonadaceae bacterium]
LGLQPPRPVPDSPEFSTLENAAEKKTNIGAIVVVCFFLLSAGVLAYFFWGDGNSQQTASSQRNTNSSLSQQAKTTTSDALKALRKVDASTQVGVSFIQYGSLLIDAQAQVNEALPLLPNGSLKNEIKQAMEAYKDANSAWLVTNKQGFIISPAPSGLIDGKELIQKYSIPPSPLSGTNDYGQYVVTVTREDALNTIWKTARKHVDRASSLLNNS